MATTWALTRERIADRALELIGVLPIGQTPRTELRSRALEALDGILKELPRWGYEWPKTYAGRYPLSIPGGTASLSLPSDFIRDAQITVAEDSLRDGFDRTDSTSSLGSGDSGQSYQVTSGVVFGISSGKAYVVSGSGRAYVPSMGSEGIVGITLSTVTTSESPGVGFRASGPDDCLFFAATASGYRLIKYTAGSASTLTTYATPTPASGDVIEVKFIGNAIIPVVNGTELAAYTTAAYVDNSGVLFGAGSNTSRFDNFRYSDGRERRLERLMPGRWIDLENKLESTTDYPTHFYVDSGETVRFYPVPEYFCRGYLFYQKLLDDTAATTAPDVSSMWHLALSKGVAVEVAPMFGRFGPIVDGLRTDWMIAREQGINFDSPHGDVVITFED
jgi:hypothetical protein